MKTADISGFGGGYEATCQQMLLNGLAFLKEHPDVELAYKVYQNIYGIASPQTSAAFEMDKAITSGIEDATGAMHQAVVGHLLYIHGHGYESWLAAHDPKDIYETTEEQLRAEQDAAAAEWKAKLDSGYNLLDEIPAENIITLDVDDPVSVEAARKRIEELADGEVTP